MCCRKICRAEGISREVPFGWQGQRQQQQQIPSLRCGMTTRRAGNGKGNDKGNGESNGKGNGESNSEGNSEGGNGCALRSIRRVQSKSV